jgi:precorrin-3B C17-methyltransferase
VVGIGPGHPLDRTLRAEKALESAEVLVGYKRYLDLLEDVSHGKELVSSGMTKEKERCEKAIELAAAGKRVALVSSGDSGVYGMAGLALEMMSTRGVRIPVEIVPGVTAATALASRLGAPLMLDFACISLSDLLAPWETIRKRLEAVASADLVTVLYNPRSKKRVTQLEEAVRIFLSYRGEQAPVGIGAALGTPEESVIITTLGNLLSCDVNMRSTVIIGNSSSKVTDGFFLTPRGYRL